jgi:hypothetical protein
LSVFAVVPVSTRQELVKPDGLEAPPPSSISLTLTSEDTGSDTYQPNDDYYNTRTGLCEDDDDQSVPDMHSELSVNISNPIPMDGETSLSTKTFYGSRKRKPTQPYSPSFVRRRK